MRVWLRKWIVVVISQDQTDRKCYERFIDLIIYEKMGFMSLGRWLIGTIFFCLWRDNAVVSALSIAFLKVRASPWPQLPLKSPRSRWPVKKIVKRIRILTDGGERIKIQNYFSWDRKGESPFFYDDKILFFSFINRVKSLKMEAEALKKLDWKIKKSSQMPKNSGP